MSIYFIYLAFVTIVLMVISSYIRDLLSWTMICLMKLAQNVFANNSVSFIRFGNFFQNDHLAMFNPFANFLKDSFWLIKEHPLKTFSFFFFLLSTFIISLEFSVFSKISIVIVVWNWWKFPFIYTCSCSSLSPTSISENNRCCWTIQSIISSNVRNFFLFILEYIFKTLPIKQ